MTAYVTGTSIRKVDDLVRALGCDSGISRLTVSRICAGIDADVHVREHRHVVSKAVVIATGLRADGYREVLGVDVGDSENETFWREFLTDLTDRGLGGVRLVISDAHAGLTVRPTRPRHRPHPTTRRRRSADALRPDRR